MNAAVLDKTKDYVNKISKIVNKLEKLKYKNWCNNANLGFVLHVCKVQLDYLNNFILTYACITIVNKKLKTYIDL